MALVMLLLVDEWLMNAQAKKCCCSYLRALDLLGDSQLKKKYLHLDMHS